MNSSISFQEAKEIFVKNHRLKSQSPGTYPHVIDSSVRPERFRDGQLDGLAYEVDNGQTVETKGWIYELEYPAE